MVLLTWLIHDDFLISTEKNCAFEFELHMYYIRNKDDNIHRRLAKTL